MNWQRQFDRIRIPLKHPELGFFHKQKVRSEENVDIQVMRQSSDTLQHNPPDSAAVRLFYLRTHSARWREEEGKDAAADDEPLVFPDFSGFSAALPSLRP